MGKLLIPEKSVEVRNSNGIWINSSVFKEAGNFFTKHGYYISDPEGTVAWLEFWREQRKRCLYGYSIGGVKITGDHYFYLNFSPILKVGEIRGKTANKIKGFPDFWDGDYNYFWVREIARKGILEPLAENEEERYTVLNLPSEKQAEYLKELFESLNLDVQIEPDFLLGGYNLIVGKSRRKGYSFKAAAISSNNYANRPHSLTLLGAYDKKYLYPKGLFTMAYSNISFLNQNTAWKMPSDFVNKPGQGHIRASYEESINGIKYEKGFMSEIMSLSFNDNEDAGRGKDAYDAFIEESGAFGKPGLLKGAYKATEDTVMAGALKTGMITLFGTSGDMDKGSVDYADMYLRPEAYGLLPLKNTLDENSLNTNVGFFHPINWNMEGFYDEQGNSDKEGAEKLELEIRKSLIKNGATSSDIQKRMQEKPLNPAEAFANIQINNFPIIEINNQIKKVKDNNWYITKATPVTLYREKGEVLAKPILDNSVEPIISYRSIPKNISGTVVIYEYPETPTPFGAYKIGYDPVRQNKGDSLAAIIVYKSYIKGSYYHSTIVAEYIGRKANPEEMDKIAEMLAEFYNTTIMHENNVPGVKNYFRRIKKLGLLAYQPDNVISKNIKKSKVARVYGCHMVDNLKDAGERYVLEWLNTTLDYDENGNPVTVIDRIYSLRLLEELAAYNRSGNFDLVSALFMAMFQVQEESLNKEYTKENKNKKVEKLISMIDNMYLKN